MRGLAVLTAVFLLPIGIAYSATSATPVSPGSPQAFERILQICPTFSWTAPGEAELALLVYELQGDDGAVAGDEPAIRVDLPPGATNWTPPARLCLQEGQRYGWLVLDRRSAADPEPDVRLFAIAARTGATAEVETTEAEEAAAGIAARAVAQHAGSQQGAGAPEPSFVVDIPPLLSAGAPPPALPPPLPSDIVTTQGIRYLDAHIGHVGIPGNTFVLGSEDVDDVVQRSTAGFLYLSSIVGDGDVYLLAPVPLPEGVLPSSLVCEVLDTAADDDVTITTRLNLRLLESTARTIYGPHVQTTIGVPGLVQVPYGFTATDLTGTDDYWWAEVRWQPEIAGDSLSFYGCRVGYFYWNIQH